MSELDICGSHLFERNEVVKRCHGDVATVEDLGPGEVGVYSCSGVEAAERILSRRSSADCTGAETSA